MRCLHAAHYDSKPSAGKMEKESSYVHALFFFSFFFFAKTGKSGGRNGCPLLSSVSDKQHNGLTGPVTTPGIHFFNVMFFLTLLVVSGFLRGCDWPSSRNIIYIKTYAQHTKQTRSFVARLAMTGTL